MKNKTILFFGATGSLGNEFINRNINDYMIVNFSRDECKHWNMKLDFNNHKNLHFVLGDIINKDKVRLYISNSSAIVFHHLSYVKKRVDY